jgi:hypothetical protein
LDSTDERLVAEFGSADSAEAQRLALRRRCLSSTYDFATFVCRFKDLNPVLHGSMCHWIDRPSPQIVKGSVGPRKLGIVPRAHLKSSCWTIAFNLRRATEDPNRRICIAAETINKPVKWISKMQAIILSPHYRWLFPERVPDPEKVRWNQVQLELKRAVHHEQATIEGIGVGGARTGDHYSDVHEDDLCGEEAYNSQIVMKRAIEHHVLSESLLISPNENLITTVGTRWGVNDVIDHMLRNEQNLDVFFLSCWKPNGEPIWPERFSRETLDALRLKYGPSLFAMQYENRLLAGGATEFDPKVLGSWSWKLGPQEPTIELVPADATQRRREVKLSDLAIYQILDAGLSPESDDARTANVVLGLTPPTETRPFDIILLEARANKCAPPEAVEAAVEVYEKWQPVTLAVESVGGHENFFYWMASQYPTMRLRKIKGEQTQRPKLIRVRHWYPYCGQGRFYVNRQDRGSLDWLEEFESFPRGRTVDLLDATAHGPSIWAPPDPLGNETQLQRLLREAQEESTEQGPTGICGY